jgi:hypothetical protein
MMGFRLSLHALAHCACIESRLSEASLVCSRYLHQVLTEFTNGCVDIVVATGDPCKHKVTRQRHLLQASRHFSDPKLLSFSPQLRSEWASIVPMSAPFCTGDGRRA